MRGEGGGIGSSPARTEVRRSLLGILSISTLLVAVSAAITLREGMAATETPRAVVYEAGAPPGFSGGFGEPACDGCHFSFDLNSPGGSLGISGVPERFTPGESYLLQLTLVRPGMMRGGFQLTSRFAEGGGQAGTLLPAEGEEERVSFAENAGISYLNQSVAGSRRTLPDTLRWSVRWTAPQSGGAVVFHASGNAADGDGSTSGDYIHTFMTESRAP